MCILHEIERWVFVCIRVHNVCIQCMHTNILNYGNIHECNMHLTMCKIAGQLGVVVKASGIPEF